MSESLYGYPHVDPYDIDYAIAHPMTASERAEKAGADEEWDVGERRWRGMENEEIEAAGITELRAEVKHLRNIIFGRQAVAYTNSKPKPSQGAVEGL